MNTFYFSINSLILKSLKINTKKNIIIIKIEKLFKY